MKNSPKKIICVVSLFFLSFLSVTSFAQCILSDNITITPPPAGGVFNSGQVVNFCYHVTQYDQLNANWMLGITPVFGAGWDMSTLTPGTAPVTIGSMGQWVWTSNVTSTATGLNVPGFGWYFDRDADGNPGNNYGDNCSSTPNCTWDFCWSITTGACPPNSTGASLNVTINNYADGELGSWTSLNCQNDPNYQVNATLSCTSCSTTAAISSSTQPACNLANGSATVTVTGGAANYDYDWKNSSNVTVGTTTGSASATNTVNNLPSDTYTVTITDANGCTATATVVLTAPNGVSVAITSTTQPTCTQTGSATVTATGGTPNYNYVWKNASNTVISSTPGTASTIDSAINLAGGVYTVVVTDASGCIDSTTVTLNIVAGGPSVANAGPDQSVCIGSTISLAGTMVGPAPSGLWSGGLGTYNPGNNSPTTVYTPSAAEENAGTVTLTYTPVDPGSTCPGTSDQMVITIGQQPTANAGISQSVCEGTTITLAGAFGGAATSGTWTGGAGTYSPDNTTLNAVYTPDATEVTAGFAILTLTTDDPPGACTADTSSVILHFYPKPVVNFTVDDSSGCTIHCTHFTNLTTIGGGDNVTAWVWDFGDSNTGSDSIASNHCFLNSGFYNVQLIATSSHGCLSSLVKQGLVHVFNTPDAEFEPTPNPATIIESTISLHNQSSTDVNYWNWDFGDGNTLAPTTSDPVHTYPDSATASYWVKLIVHNTDGCYDTAKHEIFIGPAYTFIYLIHFHQMEMR